MINAAPLAVFITWTIYGTHLQGDHRGWRRKRQGGQLPQPSLAQWHEDRLKYPVVLLSREQRTVVHRACHRHSQHRGWRLWEVNARSNHVHAVVTAVGLSGKTVRDQLKANCTRELRQQDDRFHGRPIWTVGGDWEYINSENDLETVCIYVRESQDRVQRHGKTGR